MKRSRSLQEWLHWLEIDAGANWVRIAGLVAGVLLLSALVTYKQFRGPLSETTFAQAVMGRQIADGRGFTTLVNYPQTFAWAEARSAAGNFVSVAKPLPELHQPPLYAAAIALALTLAPAAGVNADHVLLALNVLLLWCAALQVFFLGRKLFGVFAGVTAMCALLLSAPVWSAAMAVNGATLAMALWLCLFQLYLGGIRRNDAEDATPSWTLKKRVPVLPAIAVGCVCGLLFLCDYTAIVALPVSLVLMAMKAPGWRRYRSLLLALTGFAVVAGPWISRNVALTQSPVAFASQELALKAGDPTAEPAARRGMFSADAPDLDFNKLGNKVLTSLQQGAGRDAWAGGGIFLTAFFTAGFAYRFRRPCVNQLRWLVAITLAALVLCQAFFNSGEGERGAWLCLAPLVMIIGAGFFALLVTSNETLAPKAGLAALALLVAQAVPLARDLAAPRGAHSYNYPPYLPALFEGMGHELARGRETPLAWMADVPAGAAWYSGRRVWAQPATLAGFQRACVWQPVRALVLTPATLDRPFFSELAKAKPPAGAQPSADWPAVYLGLISGRMPDAFPLKMDKRITDGFHVLIDPATPPTGQ